MSEQIRRDVWVALLDAERQVRYYGKQFEKYNRIQSVIDGVLIVSGSLGLITLAAGLHQAIPMSCVVVGSLVSIYSRWEKPARKVAHLYSIRRDCEFLEGQWEHLWSRVQGGLVAEADALIENHELQKQLHIVTGTASLIGLSIDEDANQAAWQEAIQVKEGQYANN